MSFNTFRRRWIRRALFQVHLWTGIGLGLYIVMISLTGSIVIFRREVYIYFRPGGSVVERGERLSNAALTAAVERAYPGFTVSRITIRRRQPTVSGEVWLTDGKQSLHRLIDQYSGADLGDAEPFVTRAFEWIADLHDNLLKGRTGRVANGILSIFVTLLCLSGAVVWWPGLGNIRRAVGVKMTRNWKRVNWDLHSALGFWIFALFFMWAITGVYLAFPRPFQAIVDYAQKGRIGEGEFGPGDRFLEWFVNLHFGRFAGIGTRITWGLLGLVPVVLFVTGAVMWWNRKIYNLRLGSRNSSRMVNSQS